MSIERKKERETFAYVHTTPNIRETDVLILHGHHFYSGEYDSTSFHILYVQSVCCTQHYLQREREEWPGMCEIIAVEENIVSKMKLLLIFMDSFDSIRFHTRRYTQQFLNKK